MLVDKARVVVGDVGMYPMTGICQNNTLPHADMWRRQVAALATNPRRDSGHDMFRYSHATSNGKQFHDPSCTTLNSIIRLLSIQPNNNERRSKNNSSSSSSSRRTRMEEFKPLVYLIASFIMMYSSHSINSNLVSYPGLINVFINGVHPTNCVEFLFKVAFPFAKKMMYGEFHNNGTITDLEIFDKYLTKNPQMKATM